MRSKGFRRIDNRYFEALMSADLTRSGYKVVLAVIHKTWGWQKDNSEISLTEFTRMTGLSRRGVIDAIRQVEAQGVVKMVNTKPHIYSINHYAEWNTSKPRFTSDSEVGFTTKDAKTSPANVENFTRTSEVPTPTTHRIKEKRNFLKKGGNDTNNNFNSQGGNSPLSSKTPLLGEDETSPISEDRRQKIIALVTEKGMEKVGKSYMASRFNKSYTKQLTEAEGIQLLKYLRRQLFVESLPEAATPSRKERKDTLKARIAALLEKNGRLCSPTEIANGLGLPKQKHYLVNLTLSQNKGKVFVNPQRGLWALEVELLPSEDTRPESHSVASTSVTRLDPVIESDATLLPCVKSTGICALRTDASKPFQCAEDPERCSRRREP